MHRAAAPQLGERLVRRGWYVSVWVVKIEHEKILAVAGGSGWKGVQVAKVKGGRQSASVETRQAEAIQIGLAQIGLEEVRDDVALAPRSLLTCLA